MIDIASELESIQKLAFTPVCDWSESSEEKCSKNAKWVFRFRDTRCDYLIIVLYCTEHKDALERFLEAESFWRGECGHKIDIVIEPL